MLEFTDIQGNILRGYSLPFAQFLFLSFESTTSARSWLSGVVGEVTPATYRETTQVSSTFNIAFTYTGFAKFGVRKSILDSFSEAFREGMVSRADHLGDTGMNAPSNWENQLGTPEASESIHAMISIYGRDLNSINLKLNSILPQGMPGVSVYYTQDAKLLPGKREHFGFRDGISQPRIEGVTPSRYISGKTPISSTPSPAIAAGEFVNGYPGHGGVTHARPAAPFDKNSSYLVYRKLHQDVSSFRNYVNDTAEQLRFDPEWLASRIVGRWQDGTPIILSPDAPDGTISGDPDKINNFLFTQDPKGLGCPIGAHIRRSNPRDGLAGGVDAVNGHRLLRRGIPYGEPLQEGVPDDGSERGLLFLAFNVNLREQFEFVQRLWLNDSGFTGTLDPAQKDPLVGNNEGIGTMTIPLPNFPRRIQGIPNFVTLRYGVYLFTPGIRALHTLSN